MQATRFGWWASTVMLGLTTLVVDAFAGVLVFGAYLALLTLLGYENMQAFTALGSPRVQTLRAATGAC